MRKANLLHKGFAFVRAFVFAVALYGAVVLAQTRGLRPGTAWLPLAAILLGLALDLLGSYFVRRRQLAALEQLYEGIIGKLIVTEEAVTVLAAPGEKRLELKFLKRMDESTQGISLDFGNDVLFLPRGALEDTDWNEMAGILRATTTGR